MRATLTSIANGLLGLFDLKLTQMPREATFWTPLEAALHGLMSARGSLNVVQIGANDGKWNDPVHAFLMQEAESTNLLLVEPQPEIAALLSAGDCNTGLVGCLLMVRELEGVDAGSTSVVGGA